MMMGQFDWLRRHRGPSARQLRRLGRAWNEQVSSGWLVFSVTGHRDDIPAREHGRREPPMLMV